MRLSPIQINHTEDKLAFERAAATSLVKRTKSLFDQSVKRLSSSGLDFSDSSKYVNKRTLDALEKIEKGEATQIELASRMGVESIRMQISYLFKITYFSKLQREVGNKKAELMKSCFKIDQLKAKLSEAQLEALYKTALQELITP